MDFRLQLPVYQNAECVLNKPFVNGSYADIQGFASLPESFLMRPQQYNNKDDFAFTVNTSVKEAIGYEKHLVLERLNFAGMQIIFIYQGFVHVLSC